MKLCVVLIAIALCAAEKRQTTLQQEYLRSAYQDACIEDQHVVDAFRTAFDDYIIELFKKAAPRGNYFMTLPPHIIWITLAAIAEGANDKTQEEIFKVLNLPQNPCSRQKFYRIATTRISSTNYGSIIETRALVIDENVQVNPNWYDFVRRNSLLQVYLAPIKHNPATMSKIIQHLISTNNPGIDLNGNSVLLNSMDFNGLWTTAFAGAVIERSPFYSKTGHQIGSVDLMRVKRKARFGYASNINCKILELPVGANSEYRMIFALVVSDDADVVPTLPKLNNSTIFEVVNSLQETYLPIEVAIPRFVINSEIDMKEILMDMGIINLWNDPEATRYISNPPAPPISYIQRTTMTLKNEGIYPPPFEYPSIQASTREEQYWSQFIADRPFMFGLFDAETYTCLMATMFTKPTYGY